MPPPPIVSGSWQRTTTNPPVSIGLTLLLTNGTVIGQNPNNSRWYKLTPNSSGSYVAGTWTQIASLPTGYAPLYFGSAVLADGRVVVIGGEYNGGSSGVWTNLGAVYDPVANSWTPLTPPTGWSSIGDCQCSVMPDGTFIVANPGDTRMAQLNPVSMAWTLLNSFGKSDRHDEEGWTLLPDGTLLTCNAINAPGAQRYIPTQDTWISAGATPLSLEDPGSQELGPMVLRPDGTVFAMGATGHNAVYHPGTSLLDPGSWTAAPDFPNIAGQLDIADGPACLLPNGNVICVASPGVFNTPAHMFEFDGTNLTEVSTIPNTTRDPSYLGNMLMLPSGQVLFTDQSRDVEIYTPSGAPLDAWRPTITSAPSVVARGLSYSISGTQFNGLSQCNSYGDDSTNATNYPLVRITNNATGHISYCRTFNHSTMAVATGSAVVSTNFQVAANVEVGPSTLVVVTNGISSFPVAVTIPQPQISGTVALGDYSPSPAGTPITIQVRTAGTTTVLDTLSATLGADGSFTVATNRVGTFDVSVKASHWLSALQGSVTFAPSGASGIALALVNGDADNDNQVGPGDLNVLRTAFGVTPVNPMADLDGDGQVGPSDLNILRSNFGRTGQ